MRLFDIGSWPSLTNTSPLRRDDDVRRAIEVRLAVAGVRRGAEPQQLAAVRRELDDLMAAVVAAARVGDPDVAAGVDVDAVRPREHVRAERAEPLAVGADVQDRIDVAVGQAIVRAAALRDPQRAVGRDVDHAHRAQRSAGGRRHPARQRAIRIRRRIGGARGRERGERGESREA